MKNKLLFCTLTIMPTLSFGSDIATAAFVKEYGLMSKQNKSVGIQVEQDPVNPFMVEVKQDPQLHILIKKEQFQAKYGPTLSTIWNNHSTGIIIGSTLLTVAGIFYLHEKYKPKITEWYKKYKQPKQASAPVYVYLPAPVSEPENKTATKKTATKKRRQTVQERRA